MRAFRWKRPPSARRDDPDVAAGYEIAVSACEFSRRTQAAADDKLSFSATLMRAGEVDAATQVLVEFEAEVRSEEAALIERVNEVKAGRSTSRSIQPLSRAAHRAPSRTRLARSLAIAMVGSLLVGSSALGLTLVRSGRAVIDRTPSIALPGIAAGTADAGQDRRHKRVVGGIKLLMSGSELKRYEELTTGELDAGMLQDFLMELLPAPLAHKVKDALVSATEKARSTAEQAATSTHVPKVRKKKARKAAKAAKVEPAPAESEPESEPDPAQEPDDSEDGDGGEMWLPTDGG